MHALFPGSRVPSLDHQLVLDDTQGERTVHNCPILGRSSEQIYYVLVAW